MFAKQLTALCFALLASQCGGGNDPMSQGHNPSADNPARLSSAQASSLLKDISGDYNQATSNQKPGNIVTHIQQGMQLAEKDGELSFIKDVALRQELSKRFTASVGFFGDGSIRSRLLKQDPKQAATASATLEVFFLLLKYSNVTGIEFPQYYVQGVAAEDITGVTGNVFGDVTDPYHLVQAYLINGKSIELVTFRDGKGGDTTNPATLPKTQDANKAADAATGDSTDSPADDLNRTNFLNFVYSGAAFAHFRIDGHSFIGYWDGTTLRRADSYFLDTNGQVFDGLSATKGAQTLPVQYIQILRLRSPVDAPAGASFDPTPGLVLTIYEAVLGYLSNAGVPHVLLVLFPALLGLLAFAGKKEIKNLENYLIKIFDHLTGRSKLIDEGDDRYEDSLYRKAIKLMNDNDYSEAMPLLEKAVAEDDSDSIAIVALLENYLFLGEISRFTMLYNAHKKQIDALAKGMVSRYLEIIKDYQNSEYGKMEQNIESMKNALSSASAEVHWDLQPLQAFLGARPAGLQKNMLIGLLAFLQERQKK